MNATLRHEWSRITGLVVGLASVALITAALVPIRGDVSRTTPALLLVLPVIGAGMLGGRVVAVLVALASALAFNLAFIPPYGTPNIDVFDDAVALGVFVVVGLAVGTVVAWEAARRRVAEQRATALAILNEQYELVQTEREMLLEETTRLAVLDQVDAQRRALLRSVSHDLRTPLAAIKAVASDLREHPGHDETTREELLELVIDEVERLDRIVANLLSMSRIEAGAFRPEKQAVDIAELATECTRRLGRAFKNVRVETAFPDDMPFVDADYSQVDQVMTNLLQNAARHAPSRSVVRIGGRRIAPDRVQFWVEDEGPGVVVSERTRAFDAFERGTGSTGSGLGLALCRAVVEAHGGEIAVTDGRSGGARFVVTMPAHRE